MFSFTQLRAAFSRMRFKDDTALRTIGLAKLSKTFDAYPLVEDGQKIFVLIPRGMEPAAVQKLESPAAAKAVIVLANKPDGVAKIWPTAEALQAVAPQAKAQPAKGPEPKADEGGGLDFEIVEE